MTEPATESDLQLKLATGDTVRVALQGAHVLSWRTGGQEQLYTSPRTARDGHTAIRGGVPVCFPQFNTRALGEPACPKHGFARNLPWKLESKDRTARQAQATFLLSDSEQTRAFWPHAFEARLQVRLSPGQMMVRFSVTNTDTQPWPFALALHSYLRVPDVGQVRLTGLQQQAYWDAVANPQDPLQTSVQTDRDLRFAGQVDRVYSAPGEPLGLHGPGQALQISQSKSLSETVVWNPGAELCAKFSDMPPDGHLHMLCVEAARINAPVLLAPGAQWSGWQAFKTLPSK